jgi:methionine sulfoxide reductase heme-binding subunit
MNHEYWYLSRAAGFTAYLLLFVSVALGIAIGTRLADRFARRNTLFDLLRFTTILALVFSLFHVYVLLGDGYFGFNVWQLSVPFVSPYRTWQTAVGVVALYAMVIVMVIFYVRRFIGYRAWRGIHFLTFAMFGAVALHGITAGTDTTQTWAKLIYIWTGAAILGLILYRVQYRMPDTGTFRTIRMASAVAAVGAVALLLFGTGMLNDGSPASATQADLAPNGAGQAAVDTVAHPFLDSFAGDFSGTYAQTRDGTGAHLVIDGIADGDLTAKVHIELDQVTAVPTPDDEGIETAPDDERAEARPVTTITTNTAELRDTASETLMCSGQLTGLNNGYMQATCDGTGPYAGVRISLASQLQTGSDGTLTGPMSGSMQRLS